MDFVLAALGVGARLETEKKGRGERGPDQGRAEPQTSERARDVCALESGGRRMCPTLRTCGCLARPAADPVRFRPGIGGRFLREKEEKRGEEQQSMAFVELCRAAAARTGRWLFLPPPPPPPPSAWQLEKESKAGGDRVKA